MREDRTRHFGREQCPEVIGQLRPEPAAIRSDLRIVSEDRVAPLGLRHRAEDELVVYVHSCPWVWDLAVVTIERRGE
jgi:hypothetical protein